MEPMFVVGDLAPEGFRPIKYIWCHIRLDSGGASPLVIGPGAFHARGSPPAAALRIQQRAVRALPSWSLTVPFVKHRAKSAMAQTTNHRYNEQFEGLRP